MCSHKLSAVTCRVFSVISVCLSSTLFVLICPIPSLPRDDLSSSASLSIHFSFTMNIPSSVPEGPFPEITHPSLWHGRVGAFITPIRTRCQHMIASTISGEMGAAYTELRTYTLHTSYTDCRTSRRIFLSPTHT